MVYKKFFSLFILCLCASICVFSQTKQITEKEYEQILNSAREKLSTISYRAKTKEVSYREGKLYSTSEEIKEFLKPNRYYYLTINNIEGKTKKTEQIQIGKALYCRKDDGKWEKSEFSCRGFFISPVKNIMESKFSVEETNLNGQPVKLYQKFISYEGSPASPTYFLRYKSWINNDGLLLREEVENGEINKGPFNNKDETVYEYNPKDLKIEVPVTKS